MTSAVVLRAEGVGKKYSRSLRKSMQYGVHDIARDLLRLPPHPSLRQGEFWAVDDVSFELGQGQCLGLLGPNGAGKSTLLRLLSGIYPPDRGVLWARGRIGALIELGAGFHPLLTGRENIYVNGAVMGSGRAEIDRNFDAIVAFSGLEAFLDAPVKHYSSGMHARLGFAIAVHLQHEILLVDEVLSVGDAGFRRRCIKRMRQHLSDGGAIVLVTHDLATMSSICSQALVLGAGKVLYNGSPQQAAQAYLNVTLRQLGDLEFAPGGSAQETRYGSGDVELTAISLQVAGDHEAKGLASGRPGRVRLELTARREATNFHVGFAFWEQDGTPLLTLNTQKVGRLVPHLAAGSRMTLDFNFTCPLAAGRYAVSAGIFSHEDERYLDRRLNWCTVDVRGIGNEFGIIDIPYDVEISAP